VGALKKTGPLRKKTDESMLMHPFRPLSGPPTIMGGEERPGGIRAGLLLEKNKLGSAPGHRFMFGGNSIKNRVVHSRKRSEENNRLKVSRSS